MSDVRPTDPSHALTECEASEVGHTACMLFVTLCQYIWKLRSLERGTFFIDQGLAQLNDDAALTLVRARTTEMDKDAQGVETTVKGSQNSSGPVEAPEHVHELLRSLHARSLQQEKAFNISDIPKDSFDAFMEDKFVALEEDKCQLVYQLIRASGARNVVEVRFVYKLQCSA